MKDKPTKWGVKAFVLSDSRIGYVYRLQIYTGNNTGLSSRVVCDLLDGFEHKNLDVYMDRFYWNPDLFFTLAGKGIGACGTVQPNRKNSPRIWL